jgi:hypothetical protein
MLFTLTQMLLQPINACMRFTNSLSDVLELAMDLFKTMCHFFKTTFNSFHHAVQIRRTMPLFTGVMFFRAVVKLLLHALCNFMPTGRMQIFNGQANMILR